MEGHCDWEEDDMQYTKEIAAREAYDVVVAGGGPAGLGAAVAAGREGLKTLLVEANGMLGGVSTAGALPFCLGKTSGSIPFLKMVEQNLRYEDLPHPLEAVAGLFDEMADRIKREGGGVGPGKLGQTDKYPGLSRLGCHDEFTFDLETGKRVMDEMVTGAGVDILFYTQALDVRMEDNEVKGVYLVNKDGMTFVPVKAVIDCTGDADLISRAGYATYKGDRETGKMAGISFVIHIENIDSGSIEQYLNKGGHPWFFDACQKAIEEHPELDLPRNLIIFPMVQDGVFMVNGGTTHNGYDGTSAEDLTRIALMGRQRAKHLVEYVFRKHIPGAENCRLRLSAVTPGVRETRRIVGEYTLTAEDMLAGKRFPDTIALAGRHFDLARGAKTEEEGKGDVQPFADKGLTVKNRIACIPYLSMIPKGSRNIVAAGRCIAADGQALGPVRIMSTCMAIGQAAGLAAKMAVEGRTSFKDIDVQQLREKIRAAGGIVDIPEA